MDNEKDKWDHINDKFFVANILLGDIKKLLKTKEKVMEAKKVKKGEAATHWGALASLRRLAAFSGSG